MAALELEDIQALIVRGYGKLPEASFMNLAVKDAERARHWLGKLADRLTDGYQRPDDQAVNVAFTSGGLRELGLDCDSMVDFSEPYREGMATKRRGRILGDTGDAAAEHWTWGGPRNSPIHLMLLLYASDSKALSRFHQQHLDEIGDYGLEQVLCLSSLTLPGRKEHFGFRDGISQPGMVGLKKCGSPENTVAAGEFLLGYKNEYDKYPISPIVVPGKDERGILPGVPDGSRPRDLGRNGSYLVFRQLEQDVHRFWKFVAQAAGECYGVETVEAQPLTAFSRRPPAAPDGVG